MKNPSNISSLIRRIAFFAVMLPAAACSNLLDLEDDGRTEYRVIFSNRQKIAAFYSTCLNNIYTAGLSTAGFCDEGVNASLYDNTSIIRWYSGQITTANHNINPWGGDPWNSLYSMIRRSNIFLAHIDGETSQMDLDQRNGMKSEVLAYRGYYYWQLAKRYGGAPIFTEALSPSHDFAADVRPSFSDVVRQVIADCEAALQGPNTAMGFPWEWSQRTSGHINPATCHAIMSEAATYAVSPLWYDGSISREYATEITGRALGECLSHGYELFTTENLEIAQNAYALYFLTLEGWTGGDRESIFNTGGRLNVWNDNGLPSTAQQSNAGSCPSQNMVDCYEMKATGLPPILGYDDAEKTVPRINDASGYDPNLPYEGRDPRFEASIYYNGAIRFLNAPTGQKVETFEGGREGIRDRNRRYSPTGYYLRKYNHWNSRQGSNMDGAIRMFRLAELYLNFAETANRSHGPDVKITIAPGLEMSACDAVNEVRSRADMPPFPAGMTADEFETKYRNERTVELAFEGHRGFDVRRWKILNETDGYITGMKITGSVTPVYERFAFEERKCNTDKYLIFPINLEEVRKILLQTGEKWQNPEWDY
ncbi:MAG: RagB/SusD family nutrient uptake outer membrane protein [Bacteroidales bacterium]|nr:RagB/SusD family nutrient uptake outer membrane protein [Bacteroidales bacterium]